MVICVLFKEMSFSSSKCSLSKVLILLDLGTCIGSQDLRHKLLKNLSRASESSSSHQVSDLREKLPRMQEPPFSRYDRQNQVSESRERSALGRVAESRESSMLGRSAVTREGSMIGRTTESRGSSIWRGIPESREGRILGRDPTRSSAESFARMDSSRTAYSPWSLDDIRQRSPQRITRSSLGFPPQRNFEDPQRRLGEQTYDGVRSVPYMAKKDLDAPRPITASRMISSSTLPISSARPPMPPVPPLLSQIPPPAGTLQNGPYSVCTFFPSTLLKQLPVEHFLVNSTIRYKMVRDDGDLFFFPGLAS